MQWRARNYPRANWIPSISEERKLSFVAARMWAWENLRNRSVKTARRRFSFFEKKCFLLKARLTFFANSKNRNVEPSKQSQEEPNIFLALIRNSPAFMHCFHNGFVSIVFSSYPLWRKEPASPGWQEGGRWGEGWRRWLLRSTFGLMNWQQQRVNQVAAASNSPRRGIELRCVYVLNAFSRRSVHLT